MPFSKKNKPTLHPMKSIEYSLTSFSIDYQVLYRQQCLILKLDIFLFYSQISRSFLIEEQTIYYI